MARWIAPETRTPASRMLDPRLADGLRLALARSGGALVAALRAPFAPEMAASPVPQLAYADAGLLDSGTAFP
jgi:hypothetical protein